MKYYTSEPNEDKVYHKAHEIIQSGETNSFYICNLESVRHRCELWKEMLPLVELHYAVKTNPEPEIVAELIKLGHRFDCASSYEIDLVLSLGGSPDNIIFANPCKAPSHILHAKE